MNKDFWDLFGSDYRANCLSWHHHPENPVLPPSGDSWKRLWTANPDVLEFNGQMLLYYRGNGIMPGDSEVHKDRIGLARIDSIGREGLCITELNDGLPVVGVGGSGEFDERFVLDPASVVFEGKVYLYYSAIDNSGNESVGLSISDDGIDFRKYGKVIDGRAPEAVVHNGQLMLLYQRHTDDRPGSPFDIYLASSPDGITFEEVQPDPVLTKSGRSWDALSIVTCRVEESDGVYYMLYGGSADHADEPEYFGLARSTDLINWERHPGNPIFGCGPKGSEDGGAMWFPALIQQPDCYCLLYEGSRGMYAWDLSSQICMSWIERNVLNILKKLSDEDTRVIVQCIRLLLYGGDWFFPGEEHTRMGVWDYELRDVEQLLAQTLTDGNTDPLEAANLPSETIGLAVHNSLNEVSAGIDVDDDTLEAYGLTRQLVDDVYDKWIAASGWLGGIA